MRMPRRHVLAGFMVTALLGSAAVGCGQTTINTRDFDDPPSSIPGSTGGTRPGTIPRLSTTSSSTTVAGSIPRTSTIPPTTTVPGTAMPPVTTVPRRPTTTTTTVVTKAGRDAAMQELAEHRATWDAKHPVAYRFTVGVGCFCPQSVTGPWIITARVDTREVRPATPDGEQPLSSEMPPDVEGVFTKAKDALAKADQVEITYDETWGFPTRVSIDWIKDAVDDEESFTIGGFEKL